MVKLPFESVIIEPNSLPGTAAAPGTSLISSVLTKYATRGMSGIGVELSAYNNWPLTVISCEPFLSHSKVLID